jgi:hypothetical protein
METQKHFIPHISFFLLAAILIILPACSSGLTLSPTPVPLTAPYLGDPVQQNGYLLIVNTVIDPAKPDTIFTSSPGDGYKFIAIDVLTGNISGEPKAFESYQFQVIASDGKTYMGEIGLSVDGGLMSPSLRKGEQERGKVGFWIPREATAESVNFRDEDINFQAKLTPPPSGHIRPSYTLVPSFPPHGLGDSDDELGYFLTATRLENNIANVGFTSCDKWNYGYKIVAVYIGLGNLSGNEPLSTVSSHLFLVTEDGFVYNHWLCFSDDITQNLLYVIGTQGNNQVNKGEMFDGWVTFAIPNNATPAYIKYEVNSPKGNFLEIRVTP